MMSRYDVARHEIAHAAASAIEAHRIGAGRAMAHLACLRTPDRSSRLGWFAAAVDNNDTKSTRLTSASAIGPVALLPDPSVALVLRSKSLSTSTGLSADDIASIEAYKQLYGDPFALLLPATWALLDATGQTRLKNMALTLCSAEQVSILLRDLFPAERIKAALALVRTVKFNAEMNKSLRSPLPASFKEFVA